MITNERQLQITKAQIERFQASLRALEAGSLNGTDLHPLMKEMQIDAVRGQLATLRREVEDYEALRSGAVSTMRIRSLADLPEALIRARIAQGLTQRDLAERLRLKEQQVQRYEANRYEGASFARIVEVADAVGADVGDRVRLLRSLSSAQLASRLSAAGLDPEFVERRLMPDAYGHEDLVRPLVDRVSSVFGWTTDVLLSAEPLGAIPRGGEDARFKMPKGRNARTAAVYTAYARHLAEICARAMAGRPRGAVPTDWKAFRSAVEDRHGSVDFHTVLAFAWDLGVVILPLNDPGAFHGACWRFAGVNVIILKQAARFPARWLFDLLHELRHAGEQPERPEFEVVEHPETSDERRNAPQEREASWFAGQVALNGRAEELVKECLASADGGDLRKLKGAVQAVAGRRDVETGLLANYMSFRLSLQRENWWGAASNLQEVTFDVLAATRDAFFDRFPFDALAPEDLDLLTLALNDGADDGHPAQA